MALQFLNFLFQIGDIENMKDMQIRENLNRHKIIEIIRNL